MDRSFGKLDSLAISTVYSLSGIRYESVQYALLRFRFSGASRC